MKKTTFAASLATALACTGVAGAATLEDELATIKARLNALEKQVQDQNKVIAQKDREIEALKRDAPAILEGEAGNRFDTVTIGGLIEVEAGYTSPFEGDSESDLDVATAELGFAAQVTDRVAGEITLLYEEDDTDLEIDVATITVAPPDGPWYVTTGQQ
jgi:hypothetical protein